MSTLRARLFSRIGWGPIALCLFVVGQSTLAAVGQTMGIDPASSQRIFEGFGAVSGGGATTVLLKDYPEPQRSQILDLLFKPHFGASINTLYVEVPGDGNSTQGSEPSHAHDRTDLNLARGYEWWLMTEAHKRNSALTFDACGWSAPGWIGGGNYSSQDMCDYYVSWIKGLDGEYGIKLDALGCRNERGVDEWFIKLLRRTLDHSGLQGVRLHGFDNPGDSKWNWCSHLETDAQLRDSINIISNHTLVDAPAPESVKKLSERYGKPIWNTEEHVYNEGNRQYKDDFELALANVHLFNQNYIASHATKVVNWYLVGSTYPIEPYAGQPPAMYASTPWSGRYVVRPTVWSYAHVNQFVELGWKFVDSACGNLDSGGSCVTLGSGTTDFSTIIETTDAKASQSITFTLPASLARAPLSLWRTSRGEQFIRQADPVVTNGSVTLNLDPANLYTLTTTTGQQKGEFDSVPAEKSFPLPYRDDFDGYGDARRWGYLPHYTADICGDFELAERPDHKGACLRQALHTKAQSWAPEWMPYTVLGDERWTDYEVSADVFPENGWAGVMGRVCATGNGWEGCPKGYYARLYPDGGVALYVADPRYHGNHDRQLAVAGHEKWPWHQWHNLKLRFLGAHIAVLVDQKEVIAVDNKEVDHGLAGLTCAGESDARQPTCFDNLLIAPVGSEGKAQEHFTDAIHPLYRSSKANAPE